MDGCVAGADLEADLEVALEVGLADESHDALAVPGVLYDVVNELGYCYGAGAVFGLECSALGGVAGLDVLGVCLDVFRSVPDFDLCHVGFLSFFDLCDRFVFGCGYLIEQRPLLFGCVDDALFSGQERISLGCELLDVCVLCIELEIDLGETCFDLLHAHFVNFHLCLLIA